MTNDLKGILLGTLLLGVLSAADHHLVLSGALPGGKDLHLYLREEGGAWQGFALGPTFNRMPYGVVVGAYEPGGDGRPTGTVTVTIPSDGWVPKDGPLSIVYALADGAFTATLGDAVLSGAVAVSSPHPVPDTLRLDIALENAVGEPGGKPGGRRLGLHLAVLDGVVVALRGVPPGSPTDTGFAVETLGHDLRLEQGRLRGTCTLGIRRQGAMDRVVEHAYTVDLPLIAGVLAGEGGLQRAGTDCGPVQWRGTVASLPAAQEDAQCTLVLAGAIPPGNYLLCRLLLRDGVATQAIVTSPNWNNAIHRVDELALRLVDDRLQGELALTLLADPWMPADRRPRSCRYRIGAGRAAGMVQGSFTGHCDGAELAGTASGELDPLTAAPLAGLTVKLEDALQGGKEYENRVFLGIACDAEGQITGGKLSNNHSRHLKGTVSGGRIVREGDALNVSVQLVVAEGGGVDPGPYRFEVRLAVVGDLAAGSFEGGPEGGAVKQGSCWATLRSE